MRPGQQDKHFEQRPRVTELEFSQCWIQLTWSVRASFFVYALDVVRASFATWLAWFQAEIKSEEVDGFIPVTQKQVYSLK